MRKTTKKLALAFASIAAVISLAGCSNDKTVVSMKGGKITESQFYQKMKKSTAGQSTLQTMIITQALEDQYGDKVSKKKVTKEYNKYKKNYGDQLDTVLASNNMSKSDLKDNIRTNFLTEAALRDLKKPTQKQLKKQWESYEPKVTVQHILVEKEDTAKSIIKQLNDGADFNKLVKKYTTDTATKSDNGKLPAFDNTGSLDSAFMTAAFKLKTGEYTKTPVKSSYGYHVIKMIKNPGKGEMKDHTKDLKDQLYTTWLSDSTVMQKILAKVIKKANVDIKDKDLSNVLSAYVSSSSSSSKK